MYSAIVLFVIVVIQECCAQDIGDSCYGPGSIATAVIVTIIVTVLLICIIFAVWKGYLKNRREKHLILETDPERGADNQYAFDNAGFKDATTIPTPPNSTLEKNNKSTDSNKSRWSQWSPLSVLILNKNEKQKTLDDSAVQAEQVKTVLLKSHDFTGLGFNIYGNMRDGIFIKDILHRGPASESGMLNTGDRIKSVTINFDHIVYEDALTILSYASPYEVTLEARNGKILTTNHQPLNSNKTVQLGHPVYRSSSSADLTQISQTKKRLFPDESSPYTTLQKHVNTSTLEKKRPQSPSSLKSQLEQKLSPNHHQDHLKQQSAVEIRSEPAELPKTTENKYQKFGIKVLPVELKLNMSPKTTEQNENNINLEKSNVDEVDVKEFVRENSGIKRDKDGIPQEIPNHMLNAAVAAKRNRRASAETTNNNEEHAPIKSPKRLKGRAPAPPVPEKYASDSENENDSTNTIELNSSDITVHHSEEIIDRKTASTGDLTKIQKPRNGTLERAQSLDITDAGLPNLGKKRIGGLSDEGFDNSKSDSNDSLYGTELIHKEPRLSLALDGLNTFQRNRLKKSTEWGNLEDAINMNDSNNKIEAVVSRINEIKQENSETTSFEAYNGTNEIDASSEHDEESLNLLPHHILASENFLLNERDASNEDTFYNLNNACDDIKVSLSLEKPEELVSNVTVLENKNNDELYLTALDTTLVNNDITIHGPTSLTVGVPEDQTLVSNMVFNISSPSTTKQTHTYITEIQVSTPTDPEKELHKLHEIAEEQLKLLPEMRFSTSSYESSPPKSPENIPQIDQIRSTFEKAHSRSKTPPRLETKSRIPVATPGLKTPPTSPERRDSRIFNNEVDNEIIALMSSTPINNGRPKTPNKNISVTSIRSSSKIPSGLPGRPPAPPRKYEDGETNGNSSFKQWVFHPSD